MFSQTTPASLGAQSNADHATLPAHGRWNLPWLLLSLNGRTDRAPYWAAAGLQLQLLVPAFLIITTALEARVGAELAEGYANLLIMPLYLWTSIAVIVKRFHDRGKSGWWYLVRFIPFVGELWILGECGFQPGTYGANVYDKRVTLDWRTFLKKAA